MTIEKRVLAHNAEAGVTTYFYYDHATDDITIEEHQDITAVVEETKRVGLEARSDWKGDMLRIASIPLVVMEQLRRDKILPQYAGDDARFLRWLNDRDNQVFRTHGGFV